METSGVSPQREPDDGRGCLVGCLGRLGGPLPAMETPDHEQFIPGPRPRGEGEGGGRGGWGMGVGRRIEEGARGAGYTGMEDKGGAEREKGEERGVVMVMMMMSDGDCDDCCGYDDGDDDNNTQGGENYACI